MIQYVNINDVMYGEVSYIKKDIKHTKEENQPDQRHIYIINYNYQNGIKNTLNIYCENISLNNKRYDILVTKYNDPILPINKKNDSNTNMMNQLKQLKCDFIDHIIKLKLPHFDNEHAEAYKEKNILISMKNGKNLAHIIKLGSLSENNINTKITDIGQFNQLLKDYRYNNTKSGSCYLANLIINFRISLYMHENLFRISFNPYVKKMEIKYNKANTVSEFDQNDNMIMIDNTLIL